MAPIKTETARSAVPSTGSRFLQNRDSESALVMFKTNRLDFWFSYPALPGHFNASSPQYVKEFREECLDLLS